MQDLQRTVAKLEDELRVQPPQCDANVPSKAEIEALRNEVSALRKHIDSKQGSLKAAEQSVGRLSSEVERLRGLLGQAEKQQAELRGFVEETAQGMLQQVLGTVPNSARKGRARHH
jgi:chromosome segregation ATPase